MAKQVQLRRGTTAELSSVTGAIGEVIVDTTKDTLTVHDGYTAGGVPLLKEDLGNLANNSIGLGKIATGTHGQVLYYNASGQLTTLAPGSSGQYLQTAGSGANPSWATVDLTNLSASNLTSGTLPTSRLPAGSIIKRTIFEYTGRLAFSTTNAYRIYNISFNKVRSNTESYIAVTGKWAQHGSYSDWCGLYCDIDELYYGTDDSRAFWGVGYVDNGEQNSGYIQKTFDHSSLNAGSHTINVGWRTRNGSSGDRPGNVWNPNSSDDSRQHQTGTFIFIDEVAK